MPGSTTFEAMLTLRMGDDFYPGLTVGLLGAYGSFALHLTESDKPADTSANGTSADEETTSKDTQLAEFVAGYTVNLQSKRGREFHSGWGLPLGVGYNFLEDQLILEAGLQLRGFKSRTRKAVGIELRATYRLIGFKDSGFTISVGWW